MTSIAPSTKPASASSNPAIWARPTDRELALIQVGAPRGLLGLPLSLFQFFKPLLLFRHCRCQCGDFAFALLCQLACRTLPLPPASVPLLAALLLCSIWHVSKRNVCLK